MTDEPIDAEVEEGASVPAIRQGGGMVAISDATLELARQTVAPGLSEDEFAVFSHACRHTGLDPLMKQIYAIKRWDKANQREKMTIQVGIDGARLIADRTGRYAGSDDGIFSGVPKADDFASTVTVYKLVGGVRCPFTGTARWSEYCPGEKQDMMWRKMPHTMLEKCAEMKALRKAFPADLSGLYIAEEMDQADHPREIVDVTPAPAPRPQSRPASAPPRQAPPAQKAPQNAAEGHSGGIVRENAKPVPDTAMLGKVVKVFDPARGTNAKGKWARYDMVIEIEGREEKVSTFSDTFGGIAIDAQKNGLAVWLDMNPNENPKFKGDLLYIGYADGGDGEPVPASDSGDMPF